MWKLLLLIAPAALAVQAIVSHKVAHKVGATLTSCLLLLMTLPGPLGSGAAALIVGASLAVSAVGDYLLATRGKGESRFVAGIGAFLVAHLGYLAFSLLNGSPSWVVLGATLAPCLAYYLLSLRKRIAELPLSLAALVYLVASCGTLAAAVGLRGAVAFRILFVVGIGLLMFSDLVISLVEFLGWKKLEVLILPTYYLFHLCLVASIILWRA